MKIFNRNEEIKNQEIEKEAGFIKINILENSKNELQPTNIQKPIFDVSSEKDNLTKIMLNMFEENEHKMLN